MMFRERRIRALTIMTIAFALTGISKAATLVPADTDVPLAFDQTLSSKTAKAGNHVKLHVTEDVNVNGKTVIRKGAPVTGIIDKVNRRKRYGVNGKIVLVLLPVTATNGQSVPLKTRDKGKAMGKKTGAAAAATAGGAIALGPVGLVGGLFISGKEVKIKPGDPLDTETDSAVLLTKPFKKR